MHHALFIILYYDQQMQIILQFITLLHFDTIVSSAELVINTLHKYFKCSCW